MKTNGIYSNENGTFTVAIDGNEWTYRSRREAEIAYYGEAVCEPVVCDHYVLAGTLED